jgi:hypothetical protein
MPKTPLDLVVVVNRSKDADVLANFKAAVEFLVQQLGPHDRCAFCMVVFGSSVEMLYCLEYIRMYIYIYIYTYTYMYIHISIVYAFVYPQNTKI